GPDHPSLRSPLVGLGATSVALGDYARAIEHLDRAEHLGGQAPLAEDRARAKIALARALWGVGADPERARANMREALDLVADARAREGEALREEATRWLAEHDPAAGGGR
ncbi:MAG: hypothetical protein H6711_35300, partial [Myxococcales bacterium]|nr:hypothetical protein [Myxococcales bacterium]